MMPRDDNDNVIAETNKLTHNFNKKIKRVVDGMIFIGRVGDIEVGKVSRERLYCIRYDDGESISH